MCHHLYGFPLYVVKLTYSLIDEVSFRDLIFFFLERPCAYTCGGVRHRERSAVGRETRAQAPSLGHDLHNFVQITQPLWPSQSLFIVPEVSSIFTTA